MYMAYTTNPNLPRVRMQAVELVRAGWSVREVARHLGYSHNAILKWLDRQPEYGWHGRLEIPTRSSRPRHHPKELSQDIINRLLDIRTERNQCAEIIHWRLTQEGIFISISSVKRTLKRLGISKYSKWKKWHQYPPRPMPESPGTLVEVDAVHEGPTDNRVSAYALIDVNSRWAYAEPSLRINTWNTINFVKRARKEAPFAFQTIQTDHGSEFSKQLTRVIGYAGINHRHSRVRTPTDNGHVERFIRTLQDECLHRIPRDFKIWQKEIPEFIRYYNTERPHMGLNFKTPLEVVTSY
jgi:transposase InsO family protein